MSSNETEESTLNRAAARIRGAVEAYQSAMESFIKAKTVDDPEKSWKEHDKIVVMVSDGFVDEEKQDLRHLLYEHYLNILVLHEEESWTNSEERVNENTLCIYFTYGWVDVVGYTRKLGAINIHFGSANSKPGFPPRIRHSDGKLAWNESCGDQKHDEECKTLNAELLSSVIYGAHCGSEMYRNLLEELLERVKECAEATMKEDLSQVMLVTSHFFSGWFFRKVLRDCCIKAGFKRIVIESDKSLAASRIFLNLPPDKLNSKPLYIIVVVIAMINILLYAFDGDMSGDGVQLLAAADCYPISEEILKSGYERVLAQMPARSRESTRYYAVYNEYNKTDEEKIVDEVFRDGEKLTKSENIGGDKLDGILSHFCSDLTKQTKKYFDVLPSIPLNDPNFATTSKSSNKVAKSCRMDSANCDKIVAAEAQEVPNVQNLNISRNPSAPIELIGKCVAFKNGTEPLEVKGIKKGSWVVSRIDLDNLTIGEVVLICKINGFGDEVFIGVKFKKQLALGSSGIKPAHANCDKCKGRKSLFIPRQHVGSSKTHLFQVQ